ncbi:unnamed protein product [Nezara viridula]|uniref:Uncharacterized protein n=1 Tax=Nezara viridula TaxID=85310 RepID=A0A9P0HGK6_NEZVI|nr:unnamed protein product [Nezara viridula]
MAVVFFSAKSLRSRHPLIAIVEELEDIMDSRGSTHHRSWYYVGLGVSLPNTVVRIYYDCKVERELLKFVPSIFEIVKELAMFVYLTQMLVPLHMTVSSVSQIRARMEAYRHDPDSNPSKRTLELITLERRLEHVFNQLIEEYGKDFIRIIYISTGRITYSLCGALIILVPNTFAAYLYLIPMYIFPIISVVYRVWSLANAAQSVRHDQDSNPYKKTVELITLERRLEQIFHQLAEEYGTDFIRLIYVSTGRIILCLRSGLLRMPLTPRGIR